MLVNLANNNANHHSKPKVADLIEIAGYVNLTPRE